MLISSKTKTSIIVMYLVLVSFVLTSLLGCINQIFDSDDNEAKELYFKALLNNSVYEGKADAKLRDDNRMVIWGLQESEEQMVDNEDITIGISEFNGIGDYSFDRITMAVYRKWVGGDMLVFCASAEFANSENNKVIINSYNQETNIIEGTFNLDLGTKAQQTIHVRDGFFRAFVRK